MSDLRQVAIAAAAAARKASRAYVTHRDACNGCTLNTACAESLRLQSVTYAASTDSRYALLAYLPLGANVIYSGPQVHMYGEWWITGTDRAALHAAYTLGGPEGRTMDRAEITDVRTAGEPAQQQDAVLSAVRAACVQISAVLALCGVTLPVLVDIDARADVVVYFAMPVYNAALHEAYRAKGSATGAANQRAAYVVAMLDALDEMRMLARVGALHQIKAKEEAARKMRDLIVSQPTKPASRA